MAGHIQLGKFSDTTLRDYSLLDIENYQSATANPYVARVSTGGPYSELDTFNDWTISDWHSGVGNTDPESGQLFSFAETRYPGYLMSPPGWDFPVTDHNVSNTGVDSASPYEFTLLSSKMYSCSFIAPKDGDIDSVWVYVHCPYDKTVTASLRESASNLPDTVLASKTVSSIQDRVHAHWVHFVFDTPVTVIDGTRYHITIATNVTAELGNGVSPYLPAVTMTSGEACNSSTDGGTTWAAEGVGTTGFYFLVTMSGMGEHPIDGLYTYDGDIYVWSGTSVYQLVAGVYTAVVTAGTDITDVYQLGNELRVAYGTGYKIYNMDTAATNTVTLADTYRFVASGGYLWRSKGNTVSYAVDELVPTWNDLPVIAGLTGNAINGMAGLERELYFATRDGLFVAVAGDEILQVEPWPEVHDDNGKGMVAWEGALYIPLYGGTIMRYDPSGAMVNVGINAREELPADLQGTVSRLIPSNYFLMATVEGPSSTGHSSLWAYNVDGWHCIGIAPMGIGGAGLAIDRDSEYMYWGLDRLVLMRTDFPASVNNPSRNLDSLKLGRDGWVEYDRFYAGHRSLDKDFDRIFIDTMRVGQNVHVYWQDDDNYADYYVNHDGQMGWQYLGTVEYGENTIQFPATARPGGKSFRLALRLTTYDTYNTGAPIVRGVSVKHSTNVSDRWRWVLPIVVSDNQQMVDGSINEYTAAQQKSHLEELIRERAPLRFVDLDGDEYTVKVTGASRNPTRYDYLAGEADGGARVEWVYTVTVEEIS
jgi:hypothetical protein